MAIKLHFLGTGCMVPTKDRNHLSIALEREGSIFLFDCGEGTQIQIRKMKLPLSKIKKIFISHWHGDHTLGINGLVQTLSNTDNVSKVEIYGPANTKFHIDHMFKSTIFEPKIEICVTELTPLQGELIKVFENSEIEIFTAKLQHGVDCIGYLFKEKDTLNIDKKKLKEIAPELESNPLLNRIKMGFDIQYNGVDIKYKDLTYVKEGMKIALVFDTRPCAGISLLAKDVDYLVMESTFIHKQHKEKAEEFDHMSAKETAEIALLNNVSNLIITHFSQRYKDTKEIESEAKEIFENTTSTYDLMTLTLKK